MKKSLKILIAIGIATFFLKNAFNILISDLWAQLDKGNIPASFFGFLFLVLLPYVPYSVSRDLIANDERIKNRNYLLALHLFLCSVWYFPAYYMYSHNIWSIGAVVVAGLGITYVSFGIGLWIFLSLKFPPQGPNIIIRENRFLHALLPVRKYVELPYFRMEKNISDFNNFRGLKFEVIRIEKYTTDWFRVYFRPRAKGEIFLVFINAKKMTRDELTLLGCKEFKFGVNHGSIISVIPNEPPSTGVKTSIPVIYIDGTKGVNEKTAYEYVQL